MTPAIDLHPIFVRERVIKACRSFFDEQQFHEVIVPVLNVAIPHEVTLFPFVTEWKNNQTTQKLVMSISPEAALKKMLAAGIGNCYAIGKCFRNLEAAGKTHNPEFLMIEWYREAATMTQIMQDVEKLFQYILANVAASQSQSPKNVPKENVLNAQGQHFDFNDGWLQLSMADLFQKYVGVNVRDVLELPALVKLAERKGYQTANANWEQLFNQLFLNEVEPHFPAQPFFLIDFPAQLSPLCAVKKDQPYLAQRFEVYINNIEVGNGNTENTNAQHVLSTFQKVQQLRAADPILVTPIDQDFIDAIASLEGQELAGIGIGLERVAMLFADQTDLHAVEPFTIPYSP